MKGGILSKQGITGRDCQNKKRKALSKRIRVPVWVKSRMNNWLPITLNQDDLRESLEDIQSRSEGFYHEQRTGN